MDRIAIIGCGGSGKSHLARALGARARHHPGPPGCCCTTTSTGTRCSKDEFAALQQGLVAAPRWVIDGNYASTLPIRLEAADTVIFLDLPARTCLQGIAQRRLRHGGGQHDTIGVYDRITWNFVRYILGYRRTMAPRVRTLIAEPRRRRQPTWRATQPPRRPPLPGQYTTTYAGTGATPG